MRALLNGFTNDAVVTDILTRLTYLTPEDVSNQALTEMMTRYIPHVQVERDTRLSKVINEVLSGICALFIEDAHSAILLDTRKYPVRGLEEPAVERVVRGARDGFTETLVTNVNLVRRRVQIRDFTSRS